MCLPLAALANQNTYIDTKSLTCLSKVVYHEARGEPLEGKRAVAYVVLNRSKSSMWPNDICEVTLQPEQFSYFNLDIPIEYTSKAWSDSLLTAKNVYTNKVTDPTNGALFFFNPKTAKPYWRTKLTYLKDIGNHRFLTLNGAKVTHERKY